MVENLRPESRPEWMMLRENDVTASAVAALMGVHPHLTYYELYAEKAKLIPKSGDEFDTEGNEAMMRGQLLESVGIDVLKKIRPKWVVNPNKIPGGIYFRDAELRLGATPDSFVVDETGRHGVVQVKSIEPAIFNQTWKQEDGTIEAPLWIVAQVILEAYLAKATFAYILALRIGHTVEADLIEVPISEKVIARIIKEADEFWARVRDRNTPAPDYRRDGRLIALLEPRDNGKAVPMHDDNAFNDAVEMRISIKKQLKELEEDLEYYENIIKSKMGPAAIATTESYYVTYKSYDVEAYEVKAGTRRPLRVRELKGGK